MLFSSIYDVLANNMFLLLKTTFNFVFIFFFLCNIKKKSQYYFHVPTE